MEVTNEAGDYIWCWSGDWSRSGHTLAPKSIEQIREGLASKVTGSIERGQAKVREIAGQAIRVADQAKDQAQRVQGAVDAGVRAFKEAKKS